MVASTPDGLPEATTKETEQPLPEGVFHLLAADEDLAVRAFCRRITVCGAMVAPSRLPPSCFPEGGSGGPDPRYCPECVREAARWIAEPGQADCAGGDAR